MTFADLPIWAQYLTQGLTLCLMLVFSAIIAARAGRTPYWALAMIVPFFYVPLMVVWMFAFCAWPKIKTDTA